MLGVASLVGGGGTERFFADVWEQFKLRGRQFDNIKLITDRHSVESLRHVGRLDSATEAVVLPEIRFVPEIIVRTIQLFLLLRSEEVDIVHIPLPAPVYLPWLWVMTRVYRKHRPKISISVVDSSLASRYHTRKLRRLFGQDKAAWLYHLFFRFIRVDGIFSWYRAFTKVFSELPLPSGPLLCTAKYCFVDDQRFQPAGQKSNVVVFASRLTSEKRPLLFVDAVCAARMQRPELVDKWKFKLYGRGPMLARVEAHIRDSSLDDIVETGFISSMETVFATSKLFVSTQMYENFTSLSMQEAMASGNAVVAFDVGETERYVKDKENGYLVPDGDVNALCSALLCYLEHPKVHSCFAKRSREIAVVENSVELFLDDIGSYWSALVGAESR